MGSWSTQSVRAGHLCGTLAHRKSEARLRWDKRSQRHKHDSFGLRGPTSCQWHKAVVCWKDCCMRSQQDIPGRQPTGLESTEAGHNPQVLGWGQRRTRRHCTWCMKSPPPESRFPADRRWGERWWKDRSSLLGTQCMQSLLPSCTSRHCRAMMCCSSHS